MKYCVLLLSFCFSFLALFSQETASSLSGKVLNEKNEVVVGATLQVTHIPTGFTVTNQTNAKGIFTLTNLKPGGPYTVKVLSVGYIPKVFEQINLSLGSNPDFYIMMNTQVITLTEVVVRSTEKKKSDGFNISTREIKVLPDMSRSLSDFTRLTPQSNNNSFAGSNFRYNNLTIDGAISNDAIGFSNSFGGISGGGQSGAAGAGTRVNPYSLDVIQEVQVQLTPYDVKLGNFTGGSVNAVTKSGTNNLHGSLYGYGRNSSLVGKSVDGLKTKMPSSFYDYQVAATLSGPILKNKLFYMVNVEETRRQEPTFYNAGGMGSAISLATATSIYNKLKNTYGYDAGAYEGAYNIFTKSNKFFGRLDFKINNKNALVVRAIYTKGWSNNLERTSTNFQFGSTDFTQYNNHLNLSSELTARISKNVTNQLNINYINVHEYRTFPGVLSPFIDIGGGAAWVGTWREAALYNMKQSTLEVSDHLTVTKGIHKLTVGTHNEFYKITYGFVNSWNGRWEYANLNNFLNDKPSRIRGAYSIAPDLPNTREAIYNNPPNPFSVALMSGYVQDEISLSNKLKLTAGLRLDYPFLNHQLPIDPGFATAVSNTLNATYTCTPFKQFTNKWLGTPTLSPRAGFRWALQDKQSVVLRGGVGIFVGRMPFAWLGYAETLTGGYYNNIDFKPTTSNTVGGNVTIPLAINPANLYATINSSALPSANAANTREVDQIDNNFKLPRILRTNLAADFKLGNGYKFSVDFMYTKTLYDVQFKQINIKDQVEYFTTGPTQSPIYTGGKLNSAYSNVYLLTNTSLGYRYNLTTQFSKHTNNVKIGKNQTMNFLVTLAYTYGVSKDISNGIRNSFQSNYEVNPAISPNNPSLAYSNFDLRHRIVGTYMMNYVSKNGNTTSLSFFYSTQSGSPYSVIYSSGGNPFGNSSNANLPYIPANPSEIVFKDIKDINGAVTYSAANQSTDFFNFINNDAYLKTRKGMYAERNGMRTPWNQVLDMKLMHEFKLGKDKKANTIQLSANIFNLLNFINNDWGRIAFVTNVNNYTVNMLQFVSDDSGKSPGKPSSGYTPTFNFIKPTGINGNYYTIDPTNSRWQMQLGIKYIF